MTIKNSSRIIGIDLHHGIMSCNVIYTYVYIHAYCIAGKFGDRFSLANETRSPISILTNI